MSVAPEPQSRAHPTNLRVAAAAFFLAAACFFVVAVSSQKPAFGLIGGLNAACGSILLLRWRRLNAEANAAPHDSNRSAPQ